jgi:glycosyltransferase involved in cell wall biosynthesis
MMRLGIDAFGADGGKSGISRYVIQLLQAMAAHDTGWEIEVLLYANERALFMPHGTQLHALGFSEYIRHPVANIAWHQLVLPSLARRRGYDVLLLTAGNRRLSWRYPCPAVGVVHDLSSLHVAGKYDVARTFYVTHILTGLIRQLSHVITISESSKRDIVEHVGIAPEQVTVIPLAADARFRPTDKLQAQARLAPTLGVRPPYIVYVSRLEHPGKNHVRLLRAFDQWKSRSGAPHQLLLAGSDWTRAAEVHRVQRTLQHAVAVHRCGFVSDAVLPDLYAGAELLVFPSLYEGFGLPLLEAMGCGLPVACADCSSLPEVVGDAAERFDPYDEQAIATALTNVLDHPQRAAQLSAAGLARSRLFSWQATALQTLALLAGLVETRR